MQLGRVPVSSFSEESKESMVEETKIPRVKRDHGAKVHGGQAHGSNGEEPLCLLFTKSP